MALSGPTGRRRVLVRWLRVVGVLVLLCVVVVALAPTILSTAAIRNSLPTEADHEPGRTVGHDDPAAEGARPGR